TPIADGPLRTMRGSLNDSRFPEQLAVSERSAVPRPGSRVLRVTGEPSVIGANPGASSRSSHPIGGLLAVRGNGVRGPPHPSIKGGGPRTPNELGAGGPRTPARAAPSSHERRRQMGRGPPDPMADALSRADSIIAKDLVPRGGQTAGAWQ